MAQGAGLRAPDAQARPSQDGAIGRNGLAVLHALIFDFMNFASGALYPSYESIAKKANVSLRACDFLHFLSTVGAGV